MRVKKRVEEDGSWLMGLVPGLELGWKLSVKWREEDGVFQIMFTEPAEKWDEAIVLTYWHKNLSTGLAAMAMGVEENYPDFPTVQLALFIDEWD